MKTTPILFQADMVRALRANLKTQTRRTRGLEVINEEPDKWRLIGITHSTAMFRSGGTFREIICPYGGPGDKLWTKETYTTNERIWDGDKSEAFMVPAIVQGLSFFRYRADDGIKGARWRPSIFMPKWASRDTLEITELRCQRVQETTWEDAEAEGLSRLSKDGERTWKYGIPDRDGLPGTDDLGWPWELWDIDSRIAYKHLWDSINAARGHGWSRNEWVWAITFRRLNDLS
jgi:hypothetical protein